MILREKLAEMSKKSASRIPPESLRVMHRATDDLLISGIMDRVIKPGDTAPQFILQDEQGNSVSSSALLTKGPLVINFYRGAW